MDNCLFCKIIADEIPSKKVHETEDLIAIYDINPRAPVHILIIPKKHIENLFFVQNSDNRLLGELLLATQKIANDLQIGDKGFKLMVSNGRGAGQEVDHLHIHFLSQKQGESVKR